MLLGAEGGLKKFDSNSRLYLSPMIGCRFGGRRERLENVKHFKRAVKTNHPTAIDLT
jgi:hypothetical protein